MTQAFGLLRRVAEDVLGFVREWKVDRGGDLLSLDAMLFDLPAKSFRRGPGTDKAHRQSLVFTHQAQEDVFGLNLRRAELTGLIAGKENDAAGFSV